MTWEIMIGNNWDLQPRECMQIDVLEVFRDNIENLLIKEREDRVKETEETLAPVRSHLNSS